MSIATEIQRLKTAKADIKTAIENKGVTVPSNATIDAYPTYVSQISSGGGDYIVESAVYDPTATYSGEFKPTNYITSATIPNGFTSIGDSAFYNYRRLTSITIPDSVTSIGDSAFYNCSNLTSITIPDSVTSIDTGAFIRCTGLPVENNIRYAGKFAVGAVDKTLSSYTIKDGTKWIGDYAFSQCPNLTSIVIPDSVINIGDRSFIACTGLTSITIPDSVTSIGNFTFLNCYIITSVTIGNSVTSIGESAFDGCTKLTSITIQATTPPTLLSYSVFNDTNNCPIYVPAESVNRYKTATNWTSLASRIQAIPSE